MTAALVAESGLPGRFRDDGYDLPPGLPFERWCEIMDTLQTIERSVKWWVGDALLYGEAEYGQDAYQAFPDAFSGSPYAESTLRAAAWVSTAFPRGTRVDGVTWTHHRVVADLPHEDALPLLEEAARVNNDPETDAYISTRHLIDKVHAIKERRKGQAVTAAGEPIETPALPWAPTKADLTDEARLALEIRLSEMSASRRASFEAGFLFALVWADQLSAFKKDGEDA